MGERRQPSSERREVIFQQQTVPADSGSGCSGVYVSALLQLILITNFNTFYDILSTTEDNQEKFFLFEVTMV